MECDTCYNISNIFTFINYKFIQELESNSDIFINFNDCIVELSFNINNSNFSAEISYPIELIKENINIEDYYNIFWNKPGFFNKYCPIIIVNLTETTNNDEIKKYRIKGCLKEVFLIDNKVVYKIKLNNCNSFNKILLEKNNLSAKILTIPKSSLDSFGTLKDFSKPLGNRFTI
jgi:hypothetical protein